MALPASLDFSPKMGGSHARTSSITIKSNSTSSYSAGSTIQWDIPVRPNSFLDQSQTYFALNLKSSGIAKLDNSVYSCFKTLSIWHGSNLLEQIDRYGVLAGILLDYTTSQDAHATSLNCMMGCESSRDGFSFAAANDTVALSFPLLSGLFSHCSKYIPLGALNESLRIELTVANDVEIFKGAASVATISNPEIHATYIELSPEAYNAVKAQNGGQFQFYGKTFKSFQYTVTPTASSTYSLTIPARLRSLTDYIVCLRKSGDQIAGAYSTTGRVMGGLDKLQIRVADQVFPQKPIECSLTNSSGACVATAFPETMKSFNSLYHGDFCSNVTRSGYYGSTGASVTDNSAAGTAICVNLEAYSGRNHVMMSGLNTLGANSQLDLTWNSTDPSTTIVTALIDVFAECDVLYSVDEFGSLVATV